MRCQVKDICGHSNLPPSYYPALFSILSSLYSLPATSTHRDFTWYDKHIDNSVCSSQLLWKTRLRVWQKLVWPGMLTTQVTTICTEHSQNSNARIVQNTTKLKNYKKNAGILDCQGHSNIIEFESTTSLKTCRSSLKKKKEIIMPSGIFSTRFEDCHAS